MIPYENVRPSTARSNTFHFFPRQSRGTFFLIYPRQNRQQSASLSTVASALPGTPHSRARTKNKSRTTLSAALMIRKISGARLSPRALSVLEKKLYMKVKISPPKMILRYTAAEPIISCGT